MTVVAIRVPETVLSMLDWDELPTPQRLKKALTLGLRAGVVPMTSLMQGDVAVEARVALSASDEQRLRELPVDKRAPASLGETAAGIVRAYCRVKSTRVEQASGEAWITRPRVEQPVMCRLMADSQRRGEILFLEASTGVGKGRSLVAHAAYIGSEGSSERVLVAAPTLAVLGQLFTEYESLREGTPKAACVIGTGEYVCETSLRALLDDPGCTELPDIEAARHWYAHDARRPWGAMKKSWLCDSLEEAAPGFPVSLVKLNQYQRAIATEEADAGVRAHARCAREARESAVVFCTHAMLGIDVVQRLFLSREDGVPRSQKASFDSHEAWWHADLESRAKSQPTGLLPHFDTVLIDEAHLLEKSFDQATSDQISIFSLKLLAEQHGTPALRSAVNRLFARLTAVGKHTSKADVGGSERGTMDRHGEEATKCVASLVRSLKRADKSIKNREARLAFSDFRRKFEWVSRKTTGSPHYAAQMSFSPTRRYPLLERSKNNVARELSFLWKYVDSAVLTSATLYQESRNGRTITDLRKELRVPVNRLGTMTPIQPNWVTAPVTAHLPPARPTEAQQERLLMPPKRDAPEVEWESYFRRIVGFMERSFLRRRSGGTLVLMTSFSAIERVSSLLSEGRLRKRIVVSERGESFERTRSRYVEAVEKGRAPIWLATGRAWTGLNVSVGSAARDDHAIDYLVIPRLPVLINCSSIRRERVFNSGHKSGFGFREVWQCGRFLRQGLGRLVRRRGVPEKEVFVLDGRIASAGQGFGVLRHIFNRYEKQQSLLID